MKLPSTGLEDHPTGTLDLSPIVHANWRLLESMTNPAEGLTASQSTTTVTASAAIFTADHVGLEILFESGEVGVIQAGSLDADPATTCTVDTSQTVASTEFWIKPASTEDAYTAILRAILKVPDLSTLTDFAQIHWDATLNRAVAKAPPFGEIYVDSASTGQTMAVGGTPEKLTAFETNNGVASHVTEDHTNDRLTITVAAVVVVIAELEFSGDASTAWTFRIYKNGSAIGRNRGANIDNANDQINLDLSAIVDAAVDDEFEIWVESPGTNEIVVEGGSLRIVPLMFS